MESAVTTRWAPSSVESVHQDTVVTGETVHVRLLHQIESEKGYYIFYFLNSRAGNFFIFLFVSKVTKTLRSEKQRPHQQGYHRFHSGPNQRARRRAPEGRVTRAFSVLRAFTSQRASSADPVLPVSMEMEKRARRQVRVEQRFQLTTGDQALLFDL